MKKHSNATFWKDHVAAALQDPVSISAYAKRHAIPVKSLYYWHKKIKRSNFASTPVAAIATPFVAVRIPEKIREQHGANFALVLAQNVRLEMAAPPAPDWLANFIRAMQGAR